MKAPNSGRHNVAVRLGTVIFCGLWACGVAASPVIEKRDGRFAFDWSSQRVKFYGEATDNHGLSEAEVQARRDAMTQLGDMVVAYYQQQYGAGDAANAAAKRALAGARSLNTTFYANGKVRIDMEAPLAKVVAPVSLAFKQDKAASAEAAHSGIVFDLDREMPPRPTYKVVDSAGGAVFSAQDVAASAFAERMMGCWLKKPSQTELAHAVGANPLHIKAKVSDDGSLQVEPAEWQRARTQDSTLLSSARIALVVP